MRLINKKINEIKVVLVYPNTINREAFPPMGIAYISSYLYECGISVKVIDLNFEPSLEIFREKLIAHKPDVIGFSFTSPLVKPAFECMNISKDEFPGSIIVAGGTHPSIMPEVTMQNKDIDFLIVGEGEVTLHELLQALTGKKEITEVKGLFYRDDNNRIKSTPLRDKPILLDGLPNIHWELIPDLKKYLEYSNHALPVMTSRGCPFKCSFCQPTLDKIFGKSIRYRKPEKVINELIELKKANLIKSFVFQDDTFTVKKSWVKEFCRLAKEKELNLKWVCNSRVDTINEEMIKDMRGIGLYKIAFGVESGSQRVLDDIMKKGTSLEKIIEVFDLCKKYSILANSFIMLGSPNETREDIEKTISLLQRIKPNWVSCTRTVLLPQTYMYDYSKENDLSLVTDSYFEQLHYADFNSITHKTDVSENELHLLKNKLYRKWAVATINNRTFLKIGVITLSSLSSVSPKFARIIGRMISKVIWIPPPIYS